MHNYLPNVWLDETNSVVHVSHHENEETNMAIDTHSYLVVVYRLLENMENIHIFVTV